MKEDIQVARKEKDELQTALDLSNNQHREALESIQNDSSRSSDQLQSKVKQFEQTIKKLQCDHKVEKSDLESKNEQLNLDILFKKQRIEKLQFDNNELTEQQFKQREELEAKLGQYGEEVTAKKMEEISRQYKDEITRKEDAFDIEKKSMMATIEKESQMVRDLE